MNNKIYISGKVTGLPPAQVALKFERAEKQLIDQGYDIVNPVKVVDNINENWATAMRKCIAALMSCDTIYMLKDWRSSNGACTELNLATSLDFKIIYEK